MVDLMEEVIADPQAAVVEVLVQEAEVPDAKN
jgi:hypothetical protein